jgi:adenylylsulfate kinase
MSWAIWITGPPGSGKSVLARATAAELRALGEPVRVLELDEIRQTLTPSATYSAAERDVVYRALAYMAALLAAAGMPVIVDATAHRRVWRDLARLAIARFAEVQLVCPPGVCRERERTRPPGHAPRGIYARAGRPGATVPGVDVPYEPAQAPELVVDTSRESVAQAAGRVVAVARALAGERAAEVAPMSTGWAIWITGRPGSGKTTLAERVAAALSTRGIPVKVLDLGTVRRFLLSAGPTSESQEEIVHRALACAAKLLTDAGAAVIVDATAPRRAWREAARELIPSFAEVQLVCPAEICVERERAVRWGLSAAQRGRAAAPSGHGAPLDMAASYEESLRPDLVLDTNAHEVSITVEQVLFLVHRLRRRASINLELA